MLGDQEGSQFHAAGRRGREGFTNRIEPLRVLSSSGTDHFTVRVIQTDECSTPIVFLVSCAVSDQSESNGWPTSRIMYYASSAGHGIEIRFTRLAGLLVSRKSVLGVDSLGDRFQLHSTRAGCKLSACADHMSERPRLYEQYTERS